MPSATPYIYISPRMMGRVDRVANPAQRGVTTETIEGYHAIWAAMIPYIPALSFTDEEAHTFGPDANSRIQWLLNRQISFLYALAQITNHQATFELRYIVDPRPGTEARVSLVLLGKSFTTDAGFARTVAQAQWERVRALFPSEAPFRYPLAPVMEETDPPGTPAWEATSFTHWFEPIADAELDSGLYGLIEIRKHEDWPVLQFMGNANLDLDYIPHPFVPPVDYTGMARLLEALSRQTHKAYVGITIRPQRLTPREEVQFTRFADWYTKAANGELINMNPVEDIRKTVLGWSEYDPYFRQRAALGKRIYESLARERQALLLTNIRIVGLVSALPALKEALGSEIIANSGTAYPCEYDAVIPHPGPQFQWARYNMRWLELERWGVSAQLAQRAPELVRFRFFVTVLEAIAVFRLPTAPPSGQLRGMEVQEDFSTEVPTDTPAPDDLVGLGQVAVGGGALPIDYRLPRSALARGITFLGEDTFIRAETVAVLVAHLAALSVPLVVIGPQDSQTMQAALAQMQGAIVPALKEKGAPERLTPPVGVRPIRWAGAAASALALAFDLPTRTCQILRLAITQTFVAAGINPDAPWMPSLVAPGFEDFLAVLTREVTQEAAQGDSRWLIRDQCLPGLREAALLSDAQLFPALPALSGPLFIPLAGVGTHEMALVKGALACVGAITELVENTAPLPQGSVPRSVLLLIDSHYFLPQKRAGDQPLSPLIEGLRQAKGSLVLVTGQPHLVDREALAAGVLAAERLPNTDALALAQHLMRLKDYQTRRLGKLDAGDMLWQRDGKTVLVRRSLPQHLSIEAPRIGGAI